MTGRELILYILANHLEDEPVFYNGAFMGFDTPASYAIKHNVGVATVVTWIQMGRVEAIKIGDLYFIPMNK